VRARFFLVRLNVGHKIFADIALVCPRFIGDDRCALTDFLDDPRDVTARPPAECSARSALHDNRARMGVGVWQAGKIERESIFLFIKVEVAGLRNPANIAVMVSAVMLRSLCRHRQKQQQDRGRDKDTSHRSPLRLLGEGG
jgi:hypothetical protein